MSERLAETWVSSGPPGALRVAYTHVFPYPGWKSFRSTCAHRTRHIRLPASTRRCRSTAERWEKSWDFLTYARPREVRANVIANHFGGRPAPLRAVRVRPRSALCFAVRRRFGNVRCLMTRYTYWSIHEPPATIFRQDYIALYYALWSGHRNAVARWISTKRNHRPGEEWAGMRRRGWRRNKNRFGRHRNFW